MYNFTLVGLQSNFFSCYYQDLLIIPVSEPVVVNPAEVNTLRNVIGEMYDGDVLAIDIDHGDLTLSSPIELNLGITMRAFSTAANTRAIGRRLMETSPEGTIGCAGTNHAIIVG